MTDDFTLEIEKLVKELEARIKNKKLLKPCPKCGVKVETLTDVVKIFGFRQTKKDVPSSIIRQSYCRKCRQK